MIIGRLRIQFKRGIFNFRIKRSSIFFANQMYELELCVAKSLEIATQSGQEFGLQNRNFNITAL